MVVTSDNFISTVRRTWADNGRNRVGLFVNEEKIDWTSKTEVFGEVSLVDEQTSLNLGVLPVTIINDIELNKPKDFEVTLGAEEASVFIFL